MMLLRLNFRRKLWVTPNVLKCICQLMLQLALLTPSGMGRGRVSAPFSQGTAKQVWEDRITATAIERLVSTREIKNDFERGLVARAPLR